MRASSLLLAAGLIAVLASTATAQAPKPDRYDLTPTDGGFVRLDRETGATAFCTPSAEGYACRAAGEPAGPTEMEALKRRVASLEETVKTLGSGLPPAPALPKDDPAAGKEQDLKLPTDQDLDRALSFMEKAVRRLKRFAEEIEKAPPQEGERL